MSQAATDTSSSSGPDLTAYQNYFSFTPMNNEAEKRKILIQTCTHCQKVNSFCYPLKYFLWILIFKKKKNYIGSFNLRWR